MSCLMDRLMISNAIILVEVFYHLTMHVNGDKERIEKRQQLEPDQKNRAKRLGLLFEKQIECSSPWVMYSGICFFQKSYNTWSACARDCAEEGGSIMWLSNSDEHQTIRGLLTFVLGQRIWFHLALRRFWTHGELFNYGTPFAKHTYRSSIIEGVGLEKGFYFQAPSFDSTFWSTDIEKKADCICRKF